MHMPHEADVEGWFRRRRVVDEPDLPRGAQLEALAGVARLYESSGLLSKSGRTRPLWPECPFAHECWAGALDAVPHDEARRGITLPWIGARYEPGAVAVVGLNLRDAGGLLCEFEIAAPTAGDPALGAHSQWSALKAGRRMVHGSPWAYRSLRSAGLVHDWLRGDCPIDRDDPRLLADVLELTARLQAVKCSPQDDARSTPTPAMTSNCPPFLLVEELQVLKPGAIVAFGLDVYDVLQRVGDHAIEDGNDFLAWGHIETSERQVPVFWLYHPAGRYWRNSHDALLKHLS
jgi:hypothetical protein